MILRVLTNFLYAILSGGTLQKICDVTTEQLRNGIVHKLHKCYLFVSPERMFVETHSDPNSVCPFVRPCVL